MFLISKRNEPAYFNKSFYRNETKQFSPKILNIEAKWINLILNCEKIEAKRIESFKTLQ
jgi:hypothetical protein